MINITDEQISQAHGILKQFPISKSTATMVIKYFTESQTIEQIKALAESKGIGVYEWTKFNSEDKSTWPEVNEDGCVVIDFCEVGHNGVSTGVLLLEPSGEYELIMECGGDVGGVIEHHVKHPFSWSYRPKPPREE